MTLSSLSLFVQDHLRWLSDFSKLNLVFVSTGLKLLDIYPEGNVPVDGEVT